MPGLAAEGRGRGVFFCDLFSGSRASSGQALQEIQEAQEPRQKRRRKRVWLDEKATVIPEKKCPQLPCNASEQVRGTACLAGTGSPER